MVRLSRRGLGLAAAGILGGLAVGCSPAIEPVTVQGLTGRKGLSIPAYQLTSQSDDQLAADLSWMAKSDVTWLRFDVFWGYLETAPGVIDWSTVDRVVDGAEREGLRLLAVVHTTPVWTRPPGTPYTFGPVGRGALSAFGRFCAAAAGRYRGRIQAWELWNEANLQQFWSPTPSPVDFVAMVAAGAAAVSLANPEASVISGGLGGATAGSDVDANIFANQVLSDLKPGTLDGFGVHPYPSMQPFSSGRLAQVDEVEKVLETISRPLPLWGTESGASTEAGKSEEQRQADLVRQVYREWLAVPDVGPLFWYTLRDYPDANGREAHFGLFRADGTPKPAAEEFAALRGTG